MWLRRVLVLTTLMMLALAESAFAQARTERASGVTSAGRGLSTTAIVPRFTTGAVLRSGTVRGLAATRLGHDRIIRVPRSRFIGHPFVPVFFYAAPVVHVQRSYIEVAPLVTRVPATDDCAIVTVLEPDNRGYWKSLKLPAAGAINIDELQRFLQARVEEGEAFQVRDAAGNILEIPGAEQLDRILVDSC